MGLSIKVVVSGKKDTLRKINSLSKSIFNYRTELDQIGKELTSYFAGQVYASQGGAIDEQWPPLSDKYALWRAKNYPGRPPLVQTGEMQNSYVYESDDNTLIIGNTAAQFPFHQSDQPREKIPRRATMALTVGVKQIISDIINEGTAKKIKDAGL